jgi:hypothetical protein
MDAVRRGVEHAASQARDIVGSRKFHRGKGSRRTGGSGKPARWTRARAGALAVRSFTHIRISQPGLWASLRKGSAPAPDRRSGRCFRLIEHAPAPGRDGNAGPAGRACAGASPGDARTSETGRKRASSRTQAQSRWRIYPQRSRSSERGSAE